MRPDITPHIWRGKCLLGSNTHFIYGNHYQEPPYTSQRLFLGAQAYQFLRQTLLRAKCIDWFLIAPKLEGRAEMGESFCVLIS